jgi:hypothetical protein
MGEKHALEVEIIRILQGIKHQQGDTEPEKDASVDTEQREEPIETIHVYMVREDEEPEDAHVIESTMAEKGDAIPLDVSPPSPPKHKETRREKLVIPLFLGVLYLLAVSGVTVLLLLPLLSPTVLITLVPVEKGVTTTATIIAVPGTPAPEQVKSRLLPPLAITQSKTVVATGKGHQDAQVARGTITFYNGLFVSQTVAAATILTGADGVEVVTDQAAIIPAGNPPAYGQATVAAHALATGSQGNIAASDINEACCATSVLAKNTVGFQGGQNARAYSYVTRTDIDNAVTSLATILRRSGRTALQAQLNQGEGLASPTCTPTATADHQPGEEAAAVTVTVSETCTGVAYDSAALQERATHLVAQAAIHQLGPSYTLLGAIRVSVVHATITDMKRGVASLAIKGEGVWVYQLTSTAQQQIKQRIAGKSEQQALCILRTLAGIQEVHMSGIADNAHLPIDPTRIHLILLYPNDQDH